MSTNETIIRPVVERLAEFGGPVFWDTNPGEAAPWTGAEVWLTLADAVDFFASEEMVQWLADLGFEKGSLMGRMEVGSPTAYLESPLGADGKCGEVLIYGTETCEECGANEVEDRVRETCGSVLCESCRSANTHRDAVLDV